MGQDVSLKNLESFIAGIGKVLARVKDVMVQDILKYIVIKHQRFLKKIQHMK